MGVRKGYKLTDGREIPEDWDIVTLSDKCVKITKGTTPTTLGFAYVDYGIPFIKAESVSESGHILKEKVAYIDPKVHAILERSQLKTGDMLFSIAGVIGRVGTVTDSDVPANINQALALIRLQSDGNADPDYYYYCLSSQLIKEQIIDITVQAAQQNLSLGYVKNLKLPMPRGKKEQADIAVALGNADSLIDSLEALIEKKRLIKRGAMEELLTGTRRLPGFSGDWRSVYFGAIGRCLRGVSYNPDCDLLEGDSSDSVKLLRASNVQLEQVVFGEVQYVRSRRVRDEQLLRENDVLLCMANGSKNLVGKAARFAKLASDGYTFGAFMGCFRTNPDVANPLLVSHYFATSQFRHHIDLLLAGSSINNLSPRSIESFSTLLPVDPLEQSAIAQVLSDMDAEIEALEAKLEKARAIKRGMMEELLTGKIRLV